MTYIDMDDPAVTRRTLVQHAMRAVEQFGEFGPATAKLIRRKLDDTPSVPDMLTVIDGYLPGVFAFDHDPRGAGPNDYANCTQHEAEHGL